MNEEKNKRIVFLDYLRLIACFMVMVIHAVEPYYFNQKGDLYIAERCDAFWVAVIDSAARSCVPLFVMASSFLLFPLRMSIGEFFRRRAMRILIPFMIWLGVYVWHFGINPLEAVFNFPMAAGHLWFVPMLLGLYIAMPLLSPWAEKASKREVSLFIGLWAFTALFPFIRRLSLIALGEPSFGAVPFLWGECPWNGFGAFHYVSGFFGYMLIAFYIRKFVPALSWAKTLSLSVPLFVVGMAIMAGGFYFLIPGGSSYPVHQPYGAAVRLEMSLEYCSLGVAAATVSLFLVIRKFTAEGWFYNRIIRPASEASYGTYLMHMIILAPLAGYFKGTLPTPASVIVVAFVSFVVSTFVSCLIRRIPLVGRFIAG